MSKDIEEVRAEDIVRTLNQGINQMDNALDFGIDAAAKFTAWRAQFSTTSDAAFSLIGSGDLYVTVDLVNRWQSAYAGFSHVNSVAHGLPNSSYVAKDAYFDWNKIWP